MKAMLKMMLAAGAAVSLSAQDPGARTQVLIDRITADRAASRSTIEFVSGDLISGKPVKGAPFSAEAVTETTQTLIDDTRIVQRTSAKQYRDSEGRERREETTSMGAILITDPVDHINYTLHPDTRTADKGPLTTFIQHASTDMITRLGASGPVFFFNGGNVKSWPPSPIDVPSDSAVPGADSVLTEQLPATQMEGVVAQGTRTTTTIPAGQIGNDRPIKVVSERWYSPDLQMTVMTKLNDPRSGETVYKLTNIVRVDQPRSLFEIPADYTVSPTFTAAPGIRFRIPPQ